MTKITTEMPGLLPVPSLARSLLVTLLFLSSAHSQSRTQAPTAASSGNASAADAAFRAGSAAYQQGDLHTAHLQFAKVVRLTPGVAAGHTAFGTVLLTEGDARAAAIELEQAHRLDPNDSNCTLNLALAYTQIGEGAKAIPLFELVERTAPQILTPDAIIAYAGVLTAASQREAAEQQLRQALSGSPDNALLHDALGSLLAQQERYDDATAQFKQAIALAPSLAAPHYHLGTVYLVQFDPDSSVHELTEANNLVKENLEYTLQLGRALRAAHQDEQAISILRHALQLAPKSVDARYELALTLQASGNTKESVPLFEQAANARPQDSAVLTNFALALVQLGDAKRAIPLYLRALKIIPNNATLREDFGVAYLQQADLDHAIEQFRAGLLIEPNNPQLHYDLGLAFKLKDDVPNAISELDQAAKLDPTLPDPPYTLGVLYMQLARFTEAQASLERATTLRPDHGDAWAMLGNVYKQNEAWDKASAALRRAIALQPDQPSPHIILASVLIRQGDVAGAAEERKKAAELSKVAVNRQRANFALDSGRLLLKRGQIADAVSQFQTAVAADPNYADAHRALADALSQQGHNADAALERQQAERLSQAQAQPSHEAPSASHP